MATFKDAVARSHRAHAKSVEGFLASSIIIPGDASEEAKKAELRSEMYALIGRLLELARQHCENERLEPGSDEALAAFDEAYRTASSIVYKFSGLPFSADERRSLSPDQVTEKMALLVPPYVENLVTYVKEKGTFGVQQEGLSRAVGKYVKGRFKSPAVDRVLAQVLTQVEIVAYIDEMLFLKNPVTEMSKLEEARPPSVVKAVWNVSMVLFVIWLVSLGIAASPLAFSALPANAMLFAGLGLAAVGTVAMLVLLVLGVKGILQERPSKRRLHNSILEMIDRMNGFFLEFKSAGTFSIAHFRKRVNDLAKAGVVWPSGLFVLLDDMEARGVRFF